MEAPAPFGIPGGRGIPLMREVVMSRLQDVGDCVPFSITPFTGQVEDARRLIERKNEELIKNNSSLAGQLEPLHGNETNKQREDVFLKNFYRVAAENHCKGAVSVIRLLTCGAGYVTGSRHAKSFDDMLCAVMKEAHDALIETYVTWVTPKDFKYDPVKALVEESPQLHKALRRLGVAITNGLSKYWKNSFVSLVLSGVGSYFKTSSDLFYVVIGEPNLDALLCREAPSAEPGFMSYAVEKARAMCEESVKNAAEAAVKAGGAGKSGNGRARPRPTHSPNSEPHSRPRTPGVLSAEEEFLGNETVLPHPTPHPKPAPPPAAASTRVADDEFGGGFL